MTNDDDNHKKMQMKQLSTRTMTIDVAKHKNNANEAAKQENDDK